MQAEPRYRSVQKEDGHTQVAHVILEAMALARFSGSQYSILLAVLRESFGWQSSTAQLSLTDFEKRTGLKRRTVQEALDTLVAEKVLVVVQPPTFRDPAVYRIQKNPWEWGKKFACVPPSAIPKDEGAPEQVREDATGAEIRTPHESATGAETCTPTGAEIRTPDPSASVAAEGESDPLKIGKDRREVGEEAAGASEPVPEWQTEDAEKFISRVIRIANKGMRRNPHMTATLEPIATTGAGRQDVADWLAEGIGRSSILAGVWNCATTYDPAKSNGVGGRIRGMGFFGPAVRRQYEIDAADDAEDLGITQGAGGTDPSVSVEDLKLLLKAGGEMLRGAETRKAAFALAAEKRPDAWARAGPVFQKLTGWGDLLNHLRNTKSTYAIDHALRDQINQLGTEQQSAA